MLRDHRLGQERRAKDRRDRRALAEAFGEFVAGLAEWDWFATITFREASLNPERAVSAVEAWLAEIEKSAGLSFAFVLAEEFGALGGRFHCHLLIGGVDGVRRDFWWREAFRRFGRARIEPCQRARAAAFYAAKYETKSLGNLHFGGAFQGRETRSIEGDFQLKEKGTASVSKRGSEIVPSANLERDFYRMRSRRQRR